MVSSYVCLGDIERNRGNWDAAEALYRQCLEIEEALGAIKDLEQIEREWDG